MRERYALAKAQKEESLAALRALELRRRRGELLERATAESALRQIVANARSKLLSLPSRAAPALAGMSPTEAEHFLRDLVHEALAELAAGTP